MSNTVCRENQAAAKEEKKVWRWRSKYQWGVTECQRARLLHAPGCLFIFIAGNHIAAVIYLDIYLFKRLDLWRNKWPWSCLLETSLLLIVFFSLLKLCAWGRRERRVRVTWAPRAFFFYKLLLPYMKVCRFRVFIYLLGFKAQIFSLGFLIQQKKNKLGI